MTDGRGGNYWNNVLQIIGRLNECCMSSLNATAKDAASDALGELLSKDLLSFAEAVWKRLNTKDTLLDRNSALQVLLWATTHEGIHTVRQQQNYVDVARRLATVMGGVLSAVADGGSVANLALFVVSTQISTVLVGSHVTPTVQAVARCMAAADDVDENEDEVRKRRTFACSALLKMMQLQPEDVLKMHSVWAEAALDLLVAAASWGPHLFAGDETTLAQAVGATPVNLRFRVLHPRLAAMRVLERLPDAA
jgi:hypothetical protein